MGMPAGSVLEVTIMGLLNDQTTMSVYHYAVTSSGTITLPIDEQNAFLNEWFNAGAGDAVATYLQAVPSNWYATRVSAQFVANIRSRKSIQPWGEQGQRAAATVSNVQQSITLQTDLSGRKQIGGKRLPVSPADCNVGALTSAQKIVLQDHADVLLTPLIEPVGGGIYYPCVYHRGPNENPKFNLVTGVIVQDTARVMRRRTVGLGI